MALFASLITIFVSMPPAAFAASPIVGAPSPLVRQGQSSQAVATPDSANGYFYAEADQGYLCSWSGNGADWSYSQNGANCLNNDIWVENNGYFETYDCVEIFWGTSYGGAGAFLGQGIAWDLTTGRYTFDYEGDNPEPGYLESMENNAASHAWTPANQFC
ncbi:hypothetical protein QRX50_20180 [Amycolatopsis carbonis]|uniref:Uncharacterized protein n=1 Tax=Amycolatopsis carbonis TaxID=715471 RepID=A0A9Y2N1F2_9PSEU|nr:hypothetical protein [Amycolatopsis sp. 2-15]WIX82917.1 hypothetical protein QRX50_20180 [Amycolatopsis sp. 2-15]